uniref:Uncharacterized protein n=1 Tax=Myotis myotis TaxID=51298 RepID=A0A7J7T6E3_MYOMY|nr:hypothetical protein mMyoMyo1_009198 [Myotis myotis]
MELCSQRLLAHVFGALVALGDFVLPTLLKSRLKFKKKKKYCVFAPREIVPLPKLKVTDCHLGLTEWCPDSVDSSKIRDIGWRTSFLAVLFLSGPTAQTSGLAFLSVALLPVYSCFFPRVLNFSRP